MRFKNEYHETLFWVIMQKMKCNDVYSRSVAYLIALDSVCRNHVEDMFDFKENIIRHDSLNASWQTGTSMKTTRLAFNLWNSCCTDGEIYTDKEGYKEYLPSESYSVAEIFCCGYAPYYWEAIKIRYPEYTVEDEQT